jgi:hypothetical protein
MVCDCSLKVEMDSLVGVGFIRCFVMRSLKMQLCLLRDDWINTFCIVHIMYKRSVASWNQYCSSSSVSSIKRKTFCIVRKGEKQIQILDDY